MEIFARIKLIDEKKKEENLMKLDIVEHFEYLEKKT